MLYAFLMFDIRLARLGRFRFTNEQNIMCKIAYLRSAEPIL